MIRTKTLQPEVILSRLEMLGAEVESATGEAAVLASMLLHYDLDRCACALERMAGPVDGVDNSIVGVLRERSGS